MGKFEKRYNDLMKHACIECNKRYMDKMDVKMKYLCYASGISRGSISKRECMKSSEMPECMYLL